MTVAEIEALPVGRELDTLVAERVMGWRLLPQGTNGACAEFWTTAPPGDDLHATEARYFMRFYASSVPEYSTDIAAAWDVVGHLMAEAHDIELRGDELKLGNDWYVQIDGVGEWTAWADTAPLAICRAALKAMQ